MSSEEKRGGGTMLPFVIVLVFAVAGGTFLWRLQSKEIDALADDLAALKQEANELSTKSEAVLGDRANLRVERNKLRERVTKLEERGARTEVALAKALADLESARKERDDYQGRALDLSKRLDDALNELATAK